MEQLHEAHEQALSAANDAELWQEVYSQTANANLERVNGELLYSNKQLHEEATAKEATSSFSNLLLYRSNQMR